MKLLITIKIKGYLLLFLLQTLFVSAQNQFILKNDTNKVSIPFKLINNLIILNVDINNVPLNLIFDTGVKQTVLINLKSTDSINLKNLKTRQFAGIGKDNVYIEGLTSSGNIINISNTIYNKSALIYIITGVDFHFSESIGVYINGFIGGELIKDYLVKIDYKRKKLEFYKPETFNYKKLKRYQKFPLEIINDKPYLLTKVQSQKNALVVDSIKLLIDTGNSDALWLFNRKKIKMPAQQKTVSDYFGLGFSGEILGKRAKIHRFFLDKKYRFKNVYAGLPDSIYFSHIIAQNPFDGLLGNEILRRFYVWFDYKKQMMYLKKYSKNYRNAFVFNDTGINLVYDGKIPVLVRKLETNFNAKLVRESIDIIREETYVYEYRFVDRIVINYIRKDSPADKAGLMMGDIILKINNIDIYQYRLDELEKEFFYHNKKHLNFLIKRKGLILSFDVYNTNQL